MKKIAIIGSGISGLSIAHMLKNNFKITVFEKDSKPGGLIKCKKVDGNLYHLVGGHCFNSKRKDVLDWFWKFFNKDLEFTKSKRNAVAMLDTPIGYPIENHLFQMNDDIIKSVINDLLELNQNKKENYSDFEDFLKNKFGPTLYRLYFKPYNEKIWKKNLSEVPLSWLEGKLPMPNIAEIMLNNIFKKKESEMVHSSFYYPKNNGSQFTADRFAEDLNIIYNYEISKLNIDNNSGKWVINENQEFDSVIFTGNIKILPLIMKDHLPKILNEKIKDLDSHGTTSVLCEIDTNDFSWIYMPDISFDAHRIICTGNFSKNNNKEEGFLSATIEFTDEMDLIEIKKQLKKIPFTPKYLDHNYTKFTYPIQDKNTRDVIKQVKSHLENKEFYNLGRFAEWEYYNMDTAIGAAMDLAKTILKS